MEIKINNDKLSIKFGMTTITGVRVAIESFNGDNYDHLYNHEWIEKEKNKFVAETDNGGKMSLTIEDYGYGVVLSANFVAGSEQEIKQVVRFHIDGYISHNPKIAIFNETPTWVNGNRFCFSMNSESVTTALVENQQVKGVDYVAFKGAKEDFGVIGAVTFDNYFSTVTLNERGKFSAVANLNEHLYRFDVVNIDPSESVSTDKFLIASSNSDALQLLGKTISKANGVVKRFKDMSGYSTGYYFGFNINEEQQLKAIDVIKKNNVDIKYLQLDWGWFKRYGDWDAREEVFPHGMKWMADKIKEAGMIPGIWISPLMNDENCKPRKEHPEWFIFGHDYQRNTRVYWDFSVEGARKWLYDLFYKISQEWGYRFIKIDFLVDRLGVGGYSKKGFNSVKNIREMWRIIRSAVTDDTYLLSCTQPMGQGVGYCDGTRISKDIFEDWEGLRNCARMTLKRLHFNEFSVVDPDCMLVRTTEQEDAECFRPNKRDEMEVDTFITYQSISGGAIIFSDKWELYKEEQFKKVKSLLPVNNEPAIPLDLYEKDIPSKFYYGKKGQFEMYALINWNDEDSEFTITLDSEQYAFEHFSKNVYEKTKKHTFKLLPHQSYILYFSSNKADFNKLGNSIMPINN